MAGKIGAHITLPAGSPYAVAFGEDQARYLLVTADPDSVLARAKAAGVPAQRIGVVGGDLLTVEGYGTISVSLLSQAHEGWLPGLMAAPAAEAVE